MLAGDSGNGREMLIKGEGALIGGNEKSKG
jgi:hypothetical protein